jgi:hypothetical protein
MRMFRDYVRHLCHYPDSLLARYYGVYSVEITNFNTTYMLVMGNGIQFDPKREEKVALFDLKGSEDSGRIEKNKNAPIMKDKNLKEELLNK